MTATTRPSRLRPSLGVDEVVPWQAGRSIVQWRGERGDKAWRKWDAVLVAATKQSRRPRRPHLAPVVTTTALAARIAAGGTAYVLHEDADAPLATQEPAGRRRGPPGRRAGGRNLARGGSTRSGRLGPTRCDSERLSCGPPARDPRRSRSSAPPPAGADHRTSKPTIRSASGEPSFGDDVNARKVHDPASSRPRSTANVPRPGAPTEAVVNPRRTTRSPDRRLPLDVRLERHRLPTHGHGP